MLRCHGLYFVVYFLLFLGAFRLLRSTSLSTFLRKHVQNMTQPGRLLSTSADTPAPGTTLSASATGRHLHVFPFFLPCRLGYSDRAEVYATPLPRSFPRDLREEVGESPGRSRGAGFR